MIKIRKRTTYTRKRIPNILIVLFSPTTIFIKNLNCKSRSIPVSIFIISSIITQIACNYIAHGIKLRAIYRISRCCCNRTSLNTRKSPCHIINIRDIYPGPTYFSTNGNKSGIILLNKIITCPINDYILNLFIKIRERTTYASKGIRNILIVLFSSITIFIKDLNCKSRSTPVSIFIASTTAKIACNYIAHGIKLRTIYRISRHCCNRTSLNTCKSPNCIINVCNAYLSSTYFSTNANKSCIILLNKTITCHLNIFNLCIKIRERTTYASKGIRNILIVLFSSITIFIKDLNCKSRSYPVSFSIVSSTTAKRDRSTDALGKKLRTIDCII